MRILTFIEFLNEAENPLAQFTKGRPSICTPKILDGTVKNESGFVVYSGWKSDKLMYIGTTIQLPTDRFRWHKYNGKDLDFHIEKNCKDEDEMLDLEFELIKKYNPPMNGIKHRRQNLNKKLSDDVLQSRVGDSKWCQKCLKRRVNPGYKICYNCSRS